MIVVGIFLNADSVQYFWCSVLCEDLSRVLVIEGDGWETKKGKAGRKEVWQGGEEGGMSRQNKANKRGRRKRCVWDSHREKVRQKSNWKPRQKGPENWRAYLKMKGSCSLRSHTCKCKLPWSKGSVWFEVCFKETVRGTEREMKAETEREWWSHRGK